MQIFSLTLMGFECLVTETLTCTIWSTMCLPPSLSPIGFYYLQILNIIGGVFFTHKKWQIILLVLFPERFTAK